MEWFATFVIVFREALEVALTLILVCVTTRGLVGRNRWIWLGILGGVLGSVIVAQLMNVITSAMEGMGQEVFRAVVLAMSALLIGYTVVWMQRHSASIVQDVREVSQAVMEQRKPMIAISTIIGLTVLRDGVEIVLLSQGLFASGMNGYSLFFGGVAGLLAGTVLGFCVYFGLVRFNARKVFQLMSILLIFVAAGLAAQSVGFASAAGMIPDSMMMPLWDTSLLLSDHSFMGQFLQMIVGYSARPSSIQVFAYLATVAFIFFFWRRADLPKLKNATN